MNPDELFTDELITFSDDGDDMFGDSDSEVEQWITSEEIMDRDLPPLDSGWDVEQWITPEEIMDRELPPLDSGDWW